MDEAGPAAYVWFNRKSKLYVKLLLALLALLTGFSAADAARVVEPSVTHGDGSGFSVLFEAVDAVSVSAQPAHFVHAEHRPLAALQMLQMPVLAMAASLIAAPVHRSDRSRE
ncbi:hypothetical protein [Blastomonas sp.]|uniref:hypothetical protein n=1 Tax=Blastomonas sp. TaxID=1909299 RepID=UPI003593FB46